MRRTILLAAFVAASFAAHAVPLTETDYGVSSCRPGDHVNIPVVASGADLVTLYANGYGTGQAATGAFADLGVDARLMVAKEAKDQLEAYMSCDTPFLRMTQGQLEMASEAVKGTDAVPVAVFQFGYSNGGDAVVARQGITMPAHLSGRTIAVEENGPQIDFLARLLKDGSAQAGQSWKTPEIVWTSEGSGMDGDTPAALFLGNDKIDAAFVSSVEAGILTSGGTGTGAEGSVHGARTLLTTKSLNRAVSHVLAVRADYLAANEQVVKDIVQALLNAEEKVREDVLKQIVEWDSASEVLFGSGSFEDDVKQMWAGVETVGLTGNKRWSDSASARGFHTVNADLSEGFVLAGLSVGGGVSTVVSWDWDSLGGGLFDTRLSNISGFNNDAASAAVQGMQVSGALESNTLTEFEINFAPNQSEFSEAQYREQFDRVVELASAYGGAVITVEGHTEPTRFLVMKYKEKQADSVLKRQLQSALNLSVSRAQAVRDSILDYASGKGLHLDRSQFVVDGRGVQDPATGLCGGQGVQDCPAGFLKGDPVPPRTAEELARNRRVVFRMVNVEAESDVLTPVVSWD